MSDLFFCGESIKFLMVKMEECFNNIRFLDCGTIFRHCTLHIAFKSLVC